MVSTMMRFSAIRRFKTWRRMALNGDLTLSSTPISTAGSSVPSNFHPRGCLGVEKSFSRVPSWPWISPSIGRVYMTTKCDTSSSEMKELEIEIISREYIKPESPTPNDFKTFKISLLDQLIPHLYVVPLVYFFKNDGKSDISKRRELLKQSLSKTLVHFYPLAGKVKDNLHVDCNDDGMYYVEARVNAQVSHFLRHPQQKLIHSLLPFHPSSTELFTKTYVAMVQVNIFECGGIAIGIYSSHKVMDGQSTVTFMNAWAATARGSSEEIHPSFISSSIFHPNPKLPKATSILIPPPQSEQSKSATRRFVFDASALNALKNNATCAASNVTNPSRVTAAMGLIWQCAIATSQARFGFRKASILTFVVNLRSRNSPPLLPYSMGNIFWVTYAKCLVNSDLKLPSMVRRVRNGIDKLDNSFLEDIKGKDGSLVNVMKHLKELEEVHTGNLDTEYLSLSSICNQGIYNADFGWGKPIWTCIGSAGIDALGLPNLVVFMDTRSGDGIEAWVTLKENDMAIFEKIPDLLNFATLDPSPLEISLSA